LEIIRRTHTRTLFSEMKGDVSSLSLKETPMTTLTSARTLSGSLYAACAIMALAMLSVSAHAAVPNEITVQGPTEKTVGRDYATGAPIKETSVKIAVSYDPVTLTTNSGIALLKDSVIDAAHRACDAADPFADDDGTCVREAISAAQAQIARAISQARSSTNG
jgi:UrcA family protein